MHPKSQTLLGCIFLWQKRDKNTKTIALHRKIIRTKREISTKIDRRKLTQFRIIKKEVPGHYFQQQEPSRRRYKFDEPIGSTSNWPYSGLCKPPAHTRPVVMIIQAHHNPVFQSVPKDSSVPGSYQRYCPRWCTLYRSQLFPRYQHGQRRHPGRRLLHLPSRRR